MKKDKAKNKFREMELKLHIWASWKLNAINSRKTTFLFTLSEIAVLF